MLRACAWRAGKFREGDTLDVQVPISAFARTERGMGRQPHPTGGSGGLEAPQGGAGGGSPRIPRDKQSTRSRIAFMHQARHDVFAVANNHGQLTLSHQLRVPWNIELAACTSAAKFQNIAFQCYYLYSY